MHKQGLVRISCAALVLWLFAWLTPAMAQPASTAPAAAAATKKIRVVTRVVPPFIVKGDGKYAGFSADLWAAIAEQKKLQFEWVEVATVKDILSAMRDGRGDMAIAAISVTSQREQEFDFSQPIFESGVQIMVGQDGGGLGLGQIWKILTSGAMPFLLALFAALIVIPAHIAWLAERKHEERIFSNSYFPGILEAIWWATGAAGGQQSDYPRSGIGRLLSAIAILVSVVFLAFFTAELTSAITVETLKGGINGPGDLPGHRVGTVAGSTAAQYLSTLHVEATEFIKVDDMLSSLDSGHLDAVVFDAPVLLFYAAGRGKGKARVVGPILRKEDYGILFPAGSPLRKSVNEALLQLRESGAYGAIYDRWFGADGSTGGAKK